jgi:hypothetical protein
MRSGACAKWELRRCRICNKSRRRGQVRRQAAALRLGSRCCCVCTRLSQRQGAHAAGRCVVSVPLTASVCSYAMRDWPPPATTTEQPSVNGCSCPLLRRRSLCLATGRQGRNITGHATLPSVDRLAILEAGQTAGDDVPRGDEARRCLRTVASGKPISSAISKSRRWPYFFRHWKVSITAHVLGWKPEGCRSVQWAKLTLFAIAAIENTSGVDWNGPRTRSVDAHSGTFTRC